MYVFIDSRRQVHKLYVQDHLDSKKRKDASAVAAVVSQAQDLGVDVEYVTKHDLNMVVDNRPHQVHSHLCLE